MNKKNIILKATKLELYVNLVLGILVLILAIRLKGILLYAQVASSFIGAALAYTNLRFISKNKRETLKEKIWINGRKEYFFNISLSIVLIVFGLKFFEESFHIGNAHGDHVEKASIIIIAVISVIKFYVGKMTLKEGNEINATSLKVLGLITRNESFIGFLNVITMSHAFKRVPNFTKGSIIAMSVIMILTGVRQIYYYKRMLIGTGLSTSEKEAIKNRIETSVLVNSVENLFLHDYGYDNKLVTARINICDDISVSELNDQLSHVKACVYEDFQYEMILDINYKKKK